VFTVVFFLGRRIDHICHYEDKDVAQVAMDGWAEVDDSAGYSLVECNDPCACNECKWATQCAK